MIDSTVRTEDLGDINISHVSRQVALLNAYAFPLISMLNDKSRVKSTGIKTEFYDADVDEVVDAVNEEYVSVNANTDQVKVNTPLLYKVKDTVLFPQISGASRQFMGLVTAVSVSNSEITIQSINGAIVSETPVIPAIATGSVIIIMGSANDELDSVVAPVLNTLPSKDYNFCQNFMSMLDVSQFQKEHLTEADWNIDEQQRARLLNMKNKMEFSYLLGARGESDNPNGVGVTHTCNGITRYMPNLDYSVVNEAEFIKWQRIAFEKEGSSDEKIMFAGSNVINGLMLLSQFKGNSGNIVKKHGVNFFRVESPYGIMYVKSHPMMRINGLQDNAVIFDFNNIEERSFIDYKVTDLELKRMGIANSNSVVLQSVSCPIVRNSKSHLILTKI